MSPARAAALRAYEAVAMGTATLPDALAIAQAALADARDRALAAEILTGTLRWRAAIDHVLAAQSNRPLDRLDPIVLGILRLSAYQLLFLDRVPARAVVHDAVELTRAAKKSSATGFVNAILRRVTAADRATLWPPRRDDDEAALVYLETTLSHPRWLVARWVERYGFEAAEAWARFDNAAAPLTLRANRLRIDRDTLRAQLEENGVTTEPTTYAPDGLIVRVGQPLQTPLARQGLFTTQDEASQLVACVAQAAIPAWGTTGPARKVAATDAAEPRFVDGSVAHDGGHRATADADLGVPAPNVAATRAADVRILDACAAPGGKTLALAAAVAGANGLVIATDRRRRRMRLLHDTITAGQAARVRLAQVDLAAGLPFPAVFDLVLVDAPCSGLGTLRREPEIRWRRSAADLERFAVQQRRILHHAAAVVRPGGRLVYATCSSEPEENEDVAAAFLAEHPTFRALAAQDLPLSATVRAVVDAAGHLRTWPHAHGLEAFFAAVFERPAD